MKSLREKMKQKAGLKARKPLMRKPILLIKKKKEDDSLQLKDQSTQIQKKDDKSKELSTISGKRLLLRRLTSAQSKNSQKFSKLSSMKSPDNSKQDGVKSQKRLKLLSRLGNIKKKTSTLHTAKRFQTGRSSDNFLKLKTLKGKNSASPTFLNMRKKNEKESGFDFSKNLNRMKLKTSNNESNASKDLKKSTKKPFSIKLKELKLKKLNTSKKSVITRPQTNQQKKIILKRPQTKQEKTSDIGKKLFKKQEEEKKDNKDQIQKPNRIKDKCLKLEKKISLKARSIRFKKKEDLKTDIGKHKKNFISEDQKKENFHLNDQKPRKFLKPKLQSTTRLSAKTKDANKYYQYLKKRLKEIQVIELQKKITKGFKKWKSNEQAEFFRDFQTTMAFYEIKNQIGEGCFGKVYLAKQVITNRQVALKLISKKGEENKEVLKKVHKEVRILKKINNHKNVIKLFEVFEDEGFVYLVFEFAEKGDLVQYFKNNLLFEEPVLKTFFKSIMEGIQYLHKNNVIHRDLKLDNILLDKNVQPKICDFGISSEYKTNEQINDTGGTPAYLAPEVIKHECEVTPKSDIWSLGVMLYLLGFGYVPFQSANIQKLYAKIVSGKYQIPNQDFLSEEFVDLIKNMIVLDIDKRFSADQILNHKWLKDIKPQNDEKQIQKAKEKDILKCEAIDFFLQDLGFPLKYIYQSYQKNLFNHVKACRDSLYIKLGLDEA